jgi:hypothetical protein
MLDGRRPVGRVLQLARFGRLPRDTPSLCHELFFVCYNDDDQLRLKLRSSNKLSHPFTNELRDSERALTVWASTPVAEAAGRQPSELTQRNVTGQTKKANTVTNDIRITVTK